MATGDQNDMLGRIKSVLPAGWFPITASGATSSATPILDGVLSGCAAAWAWAYALLQYVVLQTRIATATDIWLDTISADFFGTNLPRLTNEADATFSARIRANLFRPKGTRAGVILALTDLTGVAPTIFEPANTGDTGGYGHTGMTVGTGLGYGVAGGYGSLLLPFQFFVTAHYGSGGGIANVAGWGDIAASVTGMPGGYGVGAIEYGNLDMVIGQVSQAEIYAAINDARPVATVAWTRID